MKNMFKKTSEADEGFPSVIFTTGLNNVNTGKDDDDDEINTTLNAITRKATKNI
jgi:hypothetical protein